MELTMRVILMTLSILAISACGLFDYTHHRAQPYPTPLNWQKHAKAECKKTGYEKGPKASNPGKPGLSGENTNFQDCVDRKVEELKKNWQTKRENNRKLLPSVGFNFGLVFGL